VNAYPDLFEDRYKICFVHLPKTGGKTFRQICRKQYKNCVAYRLTNEDRLKQLFQMPLEDIAMIDFIHGHFPISFLPPHMPKRFRYFTWLRDPVDRTISVYNYWIHSKRDFGMPAAKMVRENKMSLQDCMDTDIYEIRYWLLPYVNLLGLGVEASGTPGEVLERAIEHAARSLLTHFDFVGITERYTEGLEYLQRTYGFRTDYTIQNVTPPWAKRKTGATDEQKEQLREMLAPEYMIYEFAKKIFEKRISTDKEKIYEGKGDHTIKYGKPMDLVDADIEKDYLTDRWGAT
jgi:hypothetical protein